MGKQLRDFFGHSSVWIMTLVTLACLVLNGDAYRRGGIWLALVVGSVLFFTSEYSTHRFLFHAKPSKHRFLLRLQEKLHYNHHEDPQDLHALFLPVWYSIPNYALVFLLTWLITRDPHLALAVVSGALASLLYYEWVHFVAHRPIKPRTAWGRWVKKVHLWHHFKNENYWFGVTNPGLDYVSGTFQNEKTVELSPTARKLHQHTKTQHSQTM